MMQKKQIDWDKRIARAQDLARQHPGSAEILGFYGHILEFQAGICDGVKLPRETPDVSSFRKCLDVDLAMQLFPALLRLVEKRGPSKLAQQAADVSNAGSPRQRQMLQDFLTTPDGDEPQAHSFFARVLFQPQAEYLAAIAAEGLAGFSGSVCPVCGARPQVAVLHPEGDGGKRFLMCSFCLTEWGFRRILCPTCGEEDYQKLPRYSAEDVLAVRVEACDTCKYYLKSVDMTVDGLIVPFVDEVATAPLDLWAADQGYSKISLNLMGF